MKVTKSLLLGLAALSLAACNKDEETQALHNEKNATVSVVVKSEPKMRLGSDQDEAKINKLAVMIYNGEAQEAYKEEKNKAEVENIECSAGTRKLVIVANYGEKNFRGKTLQELLKTTEELAKATQEGKNLIMTCEPVSIDLKEGKNAYGWKNKAGYNILSENPLVIKRVNARMEFKTINVEMADGFKTVYNVKLKRVAALIAKKQSNIFGASLVNNDPDYLFGIKTPKGSYTPGKYTEETSLVMECPDANKNKELNGMGFYVLENNSLQHPTILCVEATLVQADGKDLTEDQKKAAKDAGWIDDNCNTNYPVLVNWEQDGYTYTTGKGLNKIERNHKYMVTLKITGPGTNTPEDHKKVANLDVKCEVAEWIVVNQNVVW
ncbi:fimbrial protein [Porphyromonas macacae]|uniref:fimbrial protein n=1 Tax=Porphyromonas macacae TaxID=28115 RepID=UPI0035A0BB2C